MINLPTSRSGNTPGYIITQYTWMRFTFFRPLSSNVDSKIFTSLNDQDRKSPFNVDTISSRHVMRIKKNIHKNYMVDSKYYEI